MKKFLSTMLPVFIMVAIAGICIGIYMIFTNKLPKFGNNIQNANSNVTNQVSNLSDVVLSFDELPRIDASGLTQPLTLELVRNFTQDDDISVNDFNFSTTEQGFNKLLNDEVDVLITTYPSDDIITLATSKGMDLEITPIAKDGFVFFVNSNNPIDSIKVSDIQKIYNGQVKNWSQIGGASNPIRAFQRPENSPSQNEMQLSVMKNLTMVDPPKDIFESKRYGEIGDLVALYDNSENAIGYSYYYETKILYDTDAKISDTIKLLKINDIYPSYETIKNGTYPIQTNYYMIKNKNNTSESLELFANAVLSERGKIVIKEAGYIDN